MDWYLGPLGDLRPLVCPEPDLSATQVRYGGLHQGLSGARTLDVTGHKAEYEFNTTGDDVTEFQSFGSRAFCMPITSVSHIEF